MNLRCFGQRYFLRYAGRGSRSYAGEPAL